MVACFVGFCWHGGCLLAGLLACWVLLSGFCFANTLCWSVCWLIGFWMLVCTVSIQISCSLRTTGLQYEKTNAQALLFF
jgi:hypothetical protein